MADALSWKKDPDLDAHLIHRLCLLFLYFISAVAEDGQNPPQQTRGFWLGIVMAQLQPTSKQAVRYLTGTAGKMALLLMPQCI